MLVGAAAMFAAVVSLAGVVSTPGTERLLPGQGAGNATGGFTPQRWSCLGQAATDDGTTSGLAAAGQLDATGVLWQLCGDQVLRDDGHASATLAFPAQDIAPSPDGRRLYVMQANASVRRLLVAADGSLVDDPGWRLDDFSVGGRSWTAGGWGLATDAWGDIFVSNGGWRPEQPDLILEYGADGHLKAQFGGPHGTGDGQFNENQGLAVTPDGRRVYVADHLNCRVQVFDRSPADGQYRYARQWGGCDVNDETLGLFSAVYDIALDRQGAVYVADTTWNRVQRFTADGDYIEQLQATVFATAQQHLHYVTVDARGNVFAGQTDQRFVRTVPDTAPTPVPVPLAPPDATAPTIVSIGIAPTLATTRVAFSIDARDDQAVDAMRVAGGDDAWSAWAPYEGRSAATIAAVATPQPVSVQVRDAAGNVSATFVAVVRYVDANAPVAAPVTVTTPAPPPDRVAPRMAVAKVRMRRGAAIVVVRSIDARSSTVQLRRRAGMHGRFTPWSRVRRGATIRVHLPTGAHELDLQVRDAARNATKVRRIRLPRTATTVLLTTR